MTFRGFCQRSCWLWHCSYTFSVAMLLFPLPSVFWFFSYLFPVFPTVVSLLFCVFWLADCLKRNPGWAAAALSAWGVLPDGWWLSTRIGSVGDASWYSSPCPYGGKSRAMLIYSVYPFFCSLRWDIGYKINSGFKSGFVGNVQQKYLFSFVILSLFCFWRPSQNCDWTVSSGQ